jgi:UDP-N-acetylmuramate dehydrogenase
MPEPGAPVPHPPTPPAHQRLADLTTLRLGGPASEMVQPATEGELVSTVVELDRTGRPLLLVGGGSNLVVADEGFPGTVVRLATRGLTWTDDGDHVVVRAAAGEPWDELVAASVQQGLAGIEALSGIPGLTGATPIQNVGAYGQEVADAIIGVRVLDRTTGSVRTLTPPECGFGYRRSALRGSSRYLVLATSMRLRRGAVSGPVRYAELASLLGVAADGQAPTVDVRQAVLELRRSKGMVLDASDQDTVSAGSFFTNPLLSPEQAAALPEQAPRYAEFSGAVKTSAAWLIEQAGFTRGQRLGGARISTKHTLALTNAGGATTGEVLQLARQIRDAVAMRFGVELSVEPVLVGCSL